MIVLKQRLHYSSWFRLQQLNVSISLGNVTVPSPRLLDSSNDDQIDSLSVAGIAAAAAIALLLFLVFAAFSCYRRLRKSEQAER